MNKVAISVKNLHKSFGAVSALRGVSLDIEEGTVLALLGPNGAGKTTLIRILATLLTPDSGSAEVVEFDVTRDADKVRHHIGLTGQFAAVDENLTGRENLQLVGRLYHMGGELVKRKVEKLLDDFDLVDTADRTVKTYSGGMKRRLDLAASLIGDPRILFLDEPTAGLDPASRLNLWSIIRELVKGGTTILLTTQHLEEADYLADKITVLDHGKIVAEGTAQELKSKVGGDVLEIHLLNRSMAEKAANVLKKIKKELKVDYQENRIRIPVSTTSLLADVVRALDRAKVDLLDVALRRPTLDEVFLTLTEHTVD